LREMYPPDVEFQGLGFRSWYLGMWNVISNICERLQVISPDVLI